MAVSRPHVFLDVTIGSEPAGRMTIELFTDKTPKTCENFRLLCTADKPPLTYRLSTFHRIIDSFMVQGGDITRGDGTGGDSIYGGDFADENMEWREIDAAGLVCMANHGKGTNSSQFFVTLEPCKDLSGKHTIFGRVIAGNDTLKRIAQVTVGEDDRPNVPVIISNCGELDPQSRRTIPPVVSQSATTESETDDTTGRWRRKRRRYSSQSASSNRSRTDSVSDVTVCRTDKERRNGRDYNRKDKQQCRSSHELLNIPQTKNPHRRRSDHVRDETRRGRELRKASMTPTRESSAVAVSRRKRSPSPSRGPTHVENGFRRRQSLPNQYKRYLGQEMTEIADSRRNERQTRGPRRGGRGAVNDGRLAGFRAAVDDVAGVQFKGRGSMKYHEKNLVKRG